MDTVSDLCLLSRIVSIGYSVMWHYKEKILVLNCQLLKYCFFFISANPAIAKREVIFVDIQSTTNSLSFGQRFPLHISETIQDKT